MTTERLYDNIDEATKWEIINIKRLITVAGHLQDKLADDLKTLSDLKVEIKAYETKMAVFPDMDIVLASGSHVAILTAEAMQREKSPEVNRTVFGLLGIDKFLEICTLPVPATKKALGVEQFDMVCPPHYNGTGRRFSLKKKT